MAALPPLEARTVSAIYAAYEARGRGDERTYLGLSTFGTECDRALWYGWRKASPSERFDGRKLRLFETGHREEARIIDDLRMAGVIVHDRNPVTGDQWAVSAFGGHLRGHLDGVAVNVPEAPKTEHVLEVKTHNEKSFTALINHGVEKSKPGHFWQMTGYMHLTGRTRALYVAQNKNDEGLYAERVRYDPVKAAQLMARAERILRADRPPAKLHEDPHAKMAFACEWCSARDVCHYGQFARTNCRTCLHATPLLEGEGARWRCERHNRILTDDEQRKGCPSHLFIPDLVPGIQIDADESAQTVTYAMNDGSTWIDGRAEREGAAA